MLRCESRGEIMARTAPCSASVSFNLTSTLSSGAVLVAQMRPALLRYFSRKGSSSADAEDLAQDVLVRTLIPCASKSEDEVKHYVFRAAVNRWRDLRRRLVTRGCVVGWADTADFAADEEMSPERVLGHEQELQQVVEALQGLSDRTREVFLLIRLQQMRQAEVAEKLGISVSAVEKHVARALAHLTRRAVGGREYGNQGQVGGRTAGV
jgi:RNA polymerase sigma factor (sigma-70 family)